MRRGCERARKLVREGWREGGAGLYEGGVEEPVDVEREDALEGDHCVPRRLLREVQHPVHDAHLRRRRRRGSGLVTGGSSSPPRGY